MVPDRHLRWVCAALLLAGVALSPLSRAAEGLLDGELGRWLDATVAPELGETLSRHPRFAGQTVRLVTLVPGAEPGDGNRLARALERRLRQRLLEVDGVRLAVDRQAKRGCEPPQSVDYLVRLELAPVDTRTLRVHVAVVDVAESVWVSGISYQWQGRLSMAERAAFADGVAARAPGSAGSPIPLDSPRDVAAAMKDDMACLLPGGLDGPLFVATPDSPALARVSLALQSALSIEPLAALTADREDARWLLTLQSDDSSADVRELSLTLSDTGGASSQRVAAVFVSGSFTAAPPTPPTTPSVAAAPPRPPRAGPELLSALTVLPARAEGICDSRRARVNSCVEISFELSAPAYLFVLSTRDHAVIEAPCDARIERSAAGPRRFRVRVPPGRYAVDAAETGPDAGFYVLAARSRSVAVRLQRALAAAPGQCGNGARESAAAWLSGLRPILEDRDADVAWRAVLLVHDSGGIVAL